MPSRTLALRLPDDVYAALDAKCIETGLNKSELVLTFIHDGLSLPLAAASPLDAKVLNLENMVDMALSMLTKDTTSPLEVRLMELETQLAQHKKCLDGCALEFKSLYRRLDILEDASEHLESCYDQDTPNPKQGVDLKATEILAEPERIGDKSSPVSSHNSGEAGNGTSDDIDLTSSDLDIEQAIIAVLKPYPKGGYYFRSEYLGQTKILKAYRDQATQMGFVPKDLYVDGVRLTGWLNKDYCLTAV